MKIITPEWEKVYDEMIAPLTDSTADIKQFIRQEIEKVRKEVIEEIESKLPERHCDEELGFNMGLAEIKTLLNKIKGK